MDGATTPATVGAADRRSAHRRVGAATILAFVALLLVGALRGPAEADSTLPAATPTAAPTQTAPLAPRTTTPGEPDPGLGRDDDGRGQREDGAPPGFDGGAHRGGGGPGGGAPGGDAAPAPSTGGNET